MTAMQDETVVDAKAVEGRLAAIEDTVCRHPLNREVLYRMLAYCAEERALDDLEREAASWPEFETATQNQYRLAEHLVRAGGLDRIERDERGAIVMEQDKEGLDEDAVDDLVRSVAFRTTEAGVRFVEQHRLGRASWSCCSSRRNALTCISSCWSSSELVRAPTTTSWNCCAGACWNVIGGERRRMQPSVFVDKLERSGALVWKEGWCLTEEGDAFLRDLKASE